MTQAPSRQVIAAQLLAALAHTRQMVLTTGQSARVVQLGLPVPHAGSPLWQPRLALQYMGVVVGTTQAGSAGLQGEHASPQALPAQGL
jgi:hypothetical protein